MNEEMTKYEAQQVFNSLSGAAKDVLLQLRAIKWDGYVASKSGRDELVTKGLAIKYEGYQVVSKLGLVVLEQTGKLRA